MSLDLVGKKLNRYEIQNLIGQGGMGAVYKAHDTTLKRDVAIKVMHAHFAQESDFRQRFLLEARTIARLDHPGIVKVFDFGEQDGTLYIVMEFIAGETLYEKLADSKQKREWLPLIEAVQIGNQVASALNYAHQQGVLHRDIKPANILLKTVSGESLPYRPVVTDLGLARLATGQNLTQTGTPIGTPAYLSPEQAHGKPADVRSDVYMLGILLYELVTGKPPFKVETIPEAIRYHGSEPPRPPRNKRSSIPENLENIILKALEKDPARRFSNAGELAQNLEKIAAWLARNPVSAPVNSPPPSPPPASRGRDPAPSQRSGMPGASIPPRAVSVDTLFIESETQPPRSIPIPKNEIIFGRGKEADIPLNSLGVSREHAKLRFDGKDYRIIDLDSVNGTLMDGLPLLAGVPEPWMPGKPVQIGAFTLHLIRAGKSAPAAKNDRVVTQIELSDGNLANPHDIFTSPGDGRIEATLEDHDLQVHPGEKIGTTLHVLNQGAVVEQFVITVKGVPASWVTIAPPGLNLMPGDQGSIHLQFNPPRKAESTAGIYDLIIHITSRDAPDQFLEIIAELTVFAYHDFHCEMHPVKVNAGRRARVTIRNMGNSPETFLLVLKSRADDLEFNPPGAEVEIEQEQAGAIEFVAKPRGFRLWRKQLSHPFTAELNPASGGETQSFPGEVISQGLIPGWLPPLLIMACLALGALAFLGGKYLLTPEATPTAVEVAEAETPSLDLTVLPGETSTVPSIITPPLEGPATPSATPEFCPGAPKIQVKKGDMAVVVTDDEPLRVRSSSQIIPGDGNVVYRLIHGTEVEIVRTQDSPVCFTINEDANQRVVLWLIRVTDKDITFNDGSRMGWVAEGDNLEYYIEPK